MTVAGRFSQGEEEVLLGPSEYLYSCRSASVRLGRGLKNQVWFPTPWSVLALLSPMHWEPLASADTGSLVPYPGLSENVRFTPCPSCFLHLISLSWLLFLLPLGEGVLLGQHK